MASAEKKDGGGTSRFVKATPVALARVIGLLLFKQHKKRANQLQALKDVIARPDFPPKQPKNGLWMRSEVVAWRDSNLALGKDKRTFTIHTPVTVPVRPGDLPVQNDGTGEFQLESEPNFEKSLDLWQDKLVNPEKYFMAPIQSWQMTKLQEYRPHLFKRAAGNLPAGIAGNGGQSGPDFEFPTTVTNLTTLASYYKKKFEPLAGRAFSCNKQTIIHWQAGKGVPYNKPWHPAADSASRFNIGECFKWFEAVMLPKFTRHSAAELPGIAEAEDITTMKEQEERDQILYNRWERAREQGEFVHKTVALATGVAAVKRIHLLVKTEDERNLTKMRMEKLLALGIAPMVAAQFQSWDKELARSITDRRESAMQHIAVTLPAQEKSK